MSKHHKNRYTLDSTVLWALQNRATARTFDHGHLLGVWSPAKKKYGVGAMKCACSICGKEVIVAPMVHGLVRSKSQGAMGVPAMKGEALFESCELVEKLL